MNFMTEQEQKALERKPGSPETESTLLREVVFGHSFSHFDRDQLMTYYLAIKAGLITKDTPCTFTRQPNSDQLQDQQTLVIEGFGEEAMGKNTHNYTNKVVVERDNETEIPAVSAFYQANSRSFEKSPQAAAIKDFVAWARAAESGTQRKQLSTLNSDTLQAWTEIFYALKHKFHHMPAALLSASVNLLDRVLANTPRIDLLENYGHVLNELSEKQHADEVALERRAAPEQPENKMFLRTCITMNNVRLGYFDIRGLDIEKGGMEKAFEKTQADIVMLVDDEKDENGNVIGTQMLIKMAKGADEMNMNLRQLLAERMNNNEALFGKGFVFSQTAQVGGHPGIVASAAEVGSGLHAEHLWVALQRFFDVPRYTEETFRSAAAELAKKCGIENYLPQLKVYPSSDFALSEYATQLSLPDSDGQFKTVIITEQDLSLYLSLCTEDIAANRAFIEEKNMQTEPAAVAEIRREKASGWLEFYLEDKQATRLLEVCNELNVNHLTNLPAEQLLSLLEIIAADSQAIDLIWGKQINAFQITQKVADWIEQNVEHAKNERFHYLSVAKKIDTHVMNALREKIFASNNAAQQERYIQALLTILTSPNYVAQHTKGGPDFLLESLLLFAGDTRVSETLSRHTLEQLIDKYQNQQHWQQVAFQGGIRYIQPRFPDLYTKITTNLEVPPEQAQRLPIHANNYFLPINTEALQKRIESEGTNTYATLLVEIGRPIAKDVTNKGIHAIDENGNRTQVEVTFDAEMHVRGSLLFDDQFHEETVVADKIVEFAKELCAKNPQGKVRIILGSFPNMLGIAMSVRLMQNLPPEDQKRIVLTHFNMQDSVYFDTPLL